MALPSPTLPPLTYYALNGVAIAAVVCGLYMILFGVPGTPKDVAAIILGVQSIFGGVLLAGFGTIIELLHKISLR